MLNPTHLWARASVVPWYWSRVHFPELWYSHIYWIDINNSSYQAPLFHCASKTVQFGTQHDFDERARAVRLPVPLDDWARTLGSAFATTPNCAPCKRHSVLQMSATWGPRRRPWLRRWASPRRARRTHPKLNTSHTEVVSEGRVTGEGVTCMHFIILYG